MAVYDLYRDPWGDSEAVKQGFSWPAFFFGGGWALGKKMYGLGFAFMGVAAILTVISFGLGDGATFATVALINFGYLGMSLWLGSRGNDLRRKSITARGFRQVAAGGRAVKTPQARDDFDAAEQGPGTFSGNLDSGQALSDFVVKELASNDFDQDLWTRLFSETAGDRGRTKAEYIRIRIEQLRQ